MTSESLGTLLNFFGRREYSGSYPDSSIVLPINEVNTPSVNEYNFLYKSNITRKSEGIIYSPDFLEIFDRTEPESKREYVLLKDSMRSRILLKSSFFLMRGEGFIRSIIQLVPMA